MSNNTPTLFDDFFSEEDKKEVKEPKKSRKKEKDVTEKETNTQPNGFDLFADMEIIRKEDAKTEEQPDTEKKKDLRELDSIIKAELAADYFQNSIYIEPPAPVFPEEKESNIAGEDRNYPEPQTEKESIPDRPEVNRESIAFSDDLDIPLPGWQLDKNYYGIGAVAKMFDVNISHIRFWTTEFNIKPRTNKKGDRLYTPEDIHTLRLIHYLVKVQKHTIKGAREKLKDRKQAVKAGISLKDHLVQLRDQLIEIRNHL